MLRCRRGTRIGIMSARFMRDVTASRLTYPPGPTTVTEQGSGVHWSRHGRAQHGGFAPLSLSPSPPDLRLGRNYIVITSYVNLVEFW